MPVPDAAEEHAGSVDEPDHETVGPVVPLDIFDPFEEALKPW